MLALLARSTLASPLLFIPPYSVLLQRQPRCFQSFHRLSQKASLAPHPSPRLPPINLFLLISLIGPLVGCGQERMPREPEPSVAEATPVMGDTYVDSTIGDASYLNPLLSTDSASSDINGLVFNGLVKYDKNLRIVGDLAESWTVSPDGLVITFHLRQGAAWHDGAPFTAEDVLFTYQRLVDPKVRTPYTSDFELVKSVTVLDTYTVRVTYKEPFSPGLISWGMGIIPKHIFALEPTSRGGRREDFNTHPANRHPIGTGPFRFRSWKTDDRILLSANPAYFEGRPYLDRYLYLIIPDQAVQFLELRNESIDAMTLTPDQFKAYPEFFQRYRKFRYLRPVYTYLGFNLRNPLFQSVTVRRAIAHAIDKQALVQGVLLGFGQPITGPYPPTFWAANPHIRDYAYDPKRAKALLAGEGWMDHDGDGWIDRNGRPFEFTILTNQGNKPRALTAEIIQDQLKHIGMHVHVRILEWATFLHQYVDPGAFDAVLLGWQLSFDPDQYNIWHSSQRKPGRYNFVGYADAEVDRLLEQGRRLFDQQARQQIYRRLHARLAEDEPYIFLYAPDTLSVIHRRIRGPAVAPAGMGWNFREWYVPRAEQKYPTHITYAQ